MRKKLITLALTLGTAAAAFSADDPSIQGPVREGVQRAMMSHIASNTLQDRYIIYDAQTGLLNRLTYKELHAGIVKKGDFYVSCADFVDKRGGKYDIDFLVVRKDDTFRVLQGLIHSVDGKKRAYHVEGD